MGDDSPKDSGTQDGGAVPYWTVSGVGNSFT